MGKLRQNVKEVHRYIVSSAELLSSDQWDLRLKK